MSLDRRLREGLAESARIVDPDVEHHLQRTRTSYRRRRVARQVSVVAAVGALAVAAVVVVPSLTDGRRQGSDPLPATSTTPSPSPSSPVSFVGTWTTETVTEQRVRSVLSANQLDAAATTVLADLSLPTRWTWTLAGDNYTLASADGVRYDLGRYQVEQDTTAGAGPDDLVLTLSPYCDCTIVFAAHLVGDTMTLTLVSDTSPDSNGVPDEAFQHALYTTVPFVRASV